MPVSPVTCVARCDVVRSVVCDLKDAAFNVGQVRRLRTRDRVDDDVGAHRVVRVNKPSILSGVIRRKYDGGVGQVSI